MHGSSDRGYQGTLKRLTAQQLKWNADATDAHIAAQKKLFMAGADAPVSTGDQVACVEELRWLIEQHPWFTGGDMELPMIIAVDRWTAGMMGRAAGSIYKALEYPAVYLGNCAEVIDQTGAKGRTSACIAQHWLRDDFPERLERGAYSDKKKARVALAEEITRAEYGRQLCFIDASTIGFTRYDWEEAQKVSLACDAVVIVSIGCKADGFDSIPCLGPPAESTARTRAHLRAGQAKAAAAPTPLTQQLYGAIKGMLEDPEDGSWNNIRKRQVEKLSAKVSAFEQYETQLGPAKKRLLQIGRAVIEEGGAYASDTESEDEKEPELCRPAGAPLYREKDGHYWRCCERRCVCTHSTSSGLYLQEGEEGSLN
jgi:hypothetical protein